MYTAVATQHHDGWISMVMLSALNRKLRHGMRNRAINNMPHRRASGRRIEEVQLYRGLMPHLTTALTTGRRLNNVIGNQLELDQPVLLLINTAD